MKSIYSVIEILRKGEIELIKHYYSRPVNAENKMRLALLTLALSETGLTNNDARIKLGFEMSGSGFSHLKRRLKQDMLNALLWQESGKRFAESYLAGEFECTKNIGQAYVLILRGNINEGLNVLSQARKLAVKYELVSHRIMINQLIRRRFHSLQSGKELNEVNRLLLLDIESLGMLNYAEENTLVLAAPQLFPKDATEEFRVKGDTMIQHLASKYAESGMARVGFWYLMAATEYYRSNGQFEEMLTSGMEFFELVSQSDALRSDPNISGVSQTVGIALVHLHRFKEAEDYLSISVNKFREGGMNQLKSIELLVKAQLASYATYHAKEAIDKGSSHLRVVANERLAARWNYFKACREFLISKPKESNVTLNSNTGLLKYRDDLNLQFRILEVLQLIELDERDWIEFKLDTLRKFLSRNRKLKTLRIDAVVKVLHAIQAKSYAFDSFNQATLKLVEKLHSDEEGWRWEPLGNELVRFDAWLGRRMG